MKYFKENSTLQSHLPEPPTKHQVRAISQHHSPRWTGTQQILARHI